MRKTVLVTGSSKGIGKNTVIEFAKNNYNVIINYNSDLKNAKELKNIVEKEYNVESLVIKCDISKETEVKDMVNTITNKFGNIDVLVNNASIENNCDFYEKDYNSFKKILDTNLIGTFLVSKYVGEVMLKNKSGRIINISSNNAIDKNTPSTLEYDASKAGIFSLTKNLAIEFSPYVNVNCIAPGWVLTEKVSDLNTSLNNKLVEEESKKILLNRFANMEEISKVILFLASDDASYINGSIIKVDGGSNV